MLAQRRLVSLAAERRGAWQQSSPPAARFPFWYPTGVSLGPTMIITGRFCRYPRPQVRGTKIDY